MAAGSGFGGPPTANPDARECQQADVRTGGEEKMPRTAASGEAAGEPAPLPHDRVRQGQHRGPRRRLQGGHSRHGLADARGSHMHDALDVVVPEAHDGVRGSVSGSVLLHGSANHKGRPRGNDGQNLAGSQRATRFVHDRGCDVDRASSSHEVRAAQGMGNGTCGETHPCDTPQRPAPLRADQSQAHESDATLRALSERTAGDVKRRRCEPSEDKRPVWEYPPAWMYLPHLGVGGGQDLRPAAPCASASLHASADDTPYVAGPAAIRGRDAPLGTRRAALPPASVVRAAALTNAAAANDTSGAAASTSSHGRLPSGAVDKAAERLAARNAGLAISLAQHAERVGLKDAKGRRAPELSASDRMAALRRRISERRGASAAPEPLDATTEGQEAVQSATCERGHPSQSVPPSIEDVKIHQLHGDVGIRVTTAERPSRRPSILGHHMLGIGEHGGHGDGAVGSAPRHGGGCSALTGNVATAAEAAATQVAWHTGFADVTNSAD